MKKTPTGPWIETVGGHPFHFDAPVFRIEEIAHALGNLCRYTGHSLHFYSVAEHSMLVASIMKELKLGNPFEGLMHDSVEAFMGDVASPLKAALPEYQELEKDLDLLMRKKFCLPAAMTDECHFADRVALVLEIQTLLPSRGKTWNLPEPVIEQAALLTHLKIRGLPPMRATKFFMDRYEELR